MADEYTPTTDDVRAAWQEHFTYPSVGELGEQFDRFLAQVRAEALRGFRDQLVNGYCLNFATPDDLFDQIVGLLERDASIADTNHTNGGGNA